MKEFGKSDRTRNILLDRADFSENSVPSRCATLSYMGITHTCEHADGQQAGVVKLRLHFLKIPEHTHSIL